eukprot:8936035-Heterocapsa_arctica.AAC.1
MSGRYTASAMSNATSFAMSDGPGPLALSLSSKVKAETESDLTRSLTRPKRQRGDQALSATNVARASNVCCPAQSPMSCPRRRASACVNSLEMYSTITPSTER